MSQDICFHPSLCKGSDKGSDKEVTHRSRDLIFFKKVQKIGGYGKNFQGRGKGNNWCSWNKLSVQNVGDGVEEVSV